MEVSKRRCGPSKAHQPIRISFNGLIQRKFSDASILAAL